MNELKNGESFNRIKSMPIKDLPNVATNIREDILSAVNKNGGHLSANLGVVELTLALHYIFDLPNDKLIFDVGHQCYAHKILSGRDISSALRRKGGISGFPDRDESEFDAFGTGHAGTSISAGLGFCQARDLKGEDYTVINVVGDGSLVNGLNLEALTVSNSKPKNFIVILNDNGMSISKNRNGLYHFISKRTAKKSYINSKKVARKLLGKGISKCLGGVKNFIKRLFKAEDTVEKFGFKYVGIVDGNNIKELVKILERVKSACKDKAIFLHVKTTKGKGYEKFENSADLYHGVGKNLGHEPTEVSKIVGKKLDELIEKDSNIVAITAGMKTGTGLCEVEKNHPKNFIDVGIAEEYAVTLAAGMAAGGLKPVVAIYSTFMQRAYDQIVHDVCLQNLPVVFCLDHAGFVGEDGKTHQGLYDISYLYHIPNLKILAPNSSFEIKVALEYALSLNCPVAIRYPKRFYSQIEDYSLAKEPWLTLKEGNRATLIAVGGNALSLALSVADKLEGVGVISARVIKPLDIKTLEKTQTPLVITLEENSILGGFGQVVAGYFAENKSGIKVKCLGAKDEFIGLGDVKSQLEESDLTEGQIIKIINQN